MLEEWNSIVGKFFHATDLDGNTSHGYVVAKLGDESGTYIVRHMAWDNDEDLPGFLVVTIDDFVTDRWVFYTSRQDMQAVENENDDGGPNRINLN